MRFARRVAAAVSLLFLPVFWLSAEDYPEIRALSSDDQLFIQLQEDIQDFYKATRARHASPAPAITFFSYRRHPEEDLFILNAKLNLPYESIATLNDMQDPADATRLERILVPSEPGIFVHDPPRTEQERMILAVRQNAGESPQKLVVWKGGVPQKLDFFAGSLFSEVERAYFLVILFCFPVQGATITSYYGPRRDPFDGHPEFHGGLDLGAPEGTPVHAARDGIVADEGVNQELGNYIVLSHSGGCQTIYGHLSTINVKLGQGVGTGEIIGRVGRTGMATGPHLHFAVMRNGQSTDPLPLLGRGE